MSQRWELTDVQSGVVITYTSRGSTRKATERWSRFLSVWLRNEEAK